MFRAGSGPNRHKKWLIGPLGTRILQLVDKVWWVVEPVAGK